MYFAAFLSIFLFLNSTFAAITVNIQGVGTFVQHNEIVYENGVTVFSDFTCIKNYIYYSDFQNLPVSYFKAGNGDVLPYTSLAYTSPMTVNLVSNRPIICTQN